MEKFARTIEVTVEECETLVVHRRKLVLATIWCGHCQSVVKMLRPEDAAEMTGTAPRRIYRQIEADKVHFIELSEGNLLVCVRSLLNQSK